MHVFKMIWVQSSNELKWIKNACSAQVGSLYHAHQLAWYRLTSGRSVVEVEMRKRKSRAMK